MLRITMPDQSKWDVPVLLIAQDRAKYYAKEFGGDVEKSLEQDSLPLFNEDEYEIEDWAANNMNWEDVKDQAKIVQEEAEVDYEEGWINGDKEIVDV
jgi:hypothetical protein